MDLVESWGNHDSTFKKDKSEARWIETKYIVIDSMIMDHKFARCSPHQLNQGKVSMS